MVTVGYGCHGWFRMAGGGYGVVTDGWLRVVISGSGLLLVVMSPDLMQQLT